MDQDQPRADASATIDPATIAGTQTHPSTGDSPIPNDSSTPTSDSLDSAISSSTPSYAPIVPSSDSLDNPSTVVSSGSSSPSISPKQYNDIKPVDQSKPIIGKDKPFRFNKTAVIATVAALTVIVVAGIGSLILTSSNGNNASLSGNNKPVSTNYKPQSLALGNITGYDQLLTGQAQKLQVNGKLSVADSIVLSPTTTPSNPTLGQLYYNATNNTAYIYNGKQFVSLIPSVGGTISGSSTSLSIGSGLGLQGSNLANTGVTSLVGTPNQIIASASRGSIKLSLPSNLSIAGNFSAGTITTSSLSTTNSLVTNNLNANSIIANSITGNGYGITDINPNALPSTLAYENKDNTFTAPQEFKNTTDSTNAFSIQDAAGNTLLSADTTTDSLTVNNLLPETPGQVLNGVTTNAIISNVSLDGTSNSVIGSDGFVQFAYSVNNPNTGNDDLHLVHCSNATCTTYTDQVVIAGSQVNGSNTFIYGISIALGSDSFAKIAYNYQYLDSSDNYWDNDINYVDCTNADCSTSSQTPIIQSNSDLEYYNPAITMGSNGLPQIVYGDYSQNQDVLTGLFLASCTDNTCSSTNTTTLYTGGDSDYTYPASIVLGSDGFPRILYYDGNSQNDLNFIQCTNANCTSPVNTTIDSDVNWGYIPGNLAIGSNGLPVLLYTDGNNGLTYAQCTDASCSTSNTTILDSNTNAFVNYGLAIAPDGFARISYTNGSGYPEYIDCSNAACSGATPMTVDSSDNENYEGNSLVLGSDGLARIVYNNYNTNTINFALFGTANGQTTTTGTNIGSESDPFGSVYAAQIHTTGINTSSSGQLLIQGTTDSNNALTVQDAAGNDLLNENSITKTLTVSGANGGGPVTFTGQVADVGTDACPYAVAISGTDAYVVNGCSSTLQIFNISNPANPTVISDTTIDNSPNGIAISGNYVYITGYDPNTNDPMLLAYDVSDPTNPTQVGSIDLSNLYGGDPVDFGDLSVSGNSIYLLTNDDNNGDSLLTTYNVSDPTNITQEGSVAADQWAEGITISGNYAYVTNNGSNTLEVFDISDPTNPTEVADVSTVSGPGNIAISGTDVYVITPGNSTLEVFDISDPTNPTEIADTNTDGNPQGITISGTDAYVTNYNANTLEAFDISDPTNPTEIADTSTDSGPYGIAISGTDAYVVNDNSNSLQVFDISSSSLAQWGVVTNLPVALQVNGAEAIQPTSDSINAFSIQSAGGSTLFDANTQDLSIGIGGASTTAGYALNVEGGGNFDNLYVDGSPVCTESSGCSGTSGIANSTSTQDNANFNIQSASPTDIGGVIQGAVGQTSDLLELEDSGGDPLDVFDSSGDLGVGGNLTVGNGLNVLNTNSGVTGELIQGAPSQTADLLDLQDSSGDVLDSFDAEGHLTINGASAALGPWLSSSNTLPSSNLIQATAVEANGYVYSLAGGDYYTGPLDQVSYAPINFDGSIGSWTSSPNTLPVPLVDATSIVANGYIYEIGGNTGNTYESTVYYAKLNADGSIGAWQTSTNPLPQALDNATSVEANGYVYVMGGEDSSGSPLLSTVYYAKLNADGSIGAWQTSTNPLPQALDNATSVEANGYVYVMGGFDNGGSPVSTVYSAPLNPDGTVGSWTTDSNALPQGIANTSSDVINGNVYILGGDNTAYPNCSTDNSQVATVISAPLNPDGTVGSWTTDSNALPQALDETSSVAYNGNILILGGESPGDCNFQGTVYYSSNNAALQVIGQANFAQDVSVTGNLNSNGQADFQDSTDSTTAFEIQDSSSNPILTVDSVNNAVGINGALTNGAALNVAGSTSLQDTSGQTADLLDLQDSNGNVLDSFDSSGDLTVNGADSTPSFVSQTSTGGSAAYITISGNYAYAVNDTLNALQIFNISNPNNVTQVGGNISTGSYPQSVAISGNYAYVVNGDSNTLQVFNVSNPASVTQVGSNVTTGTNPYSVAVSGNYAYVVNEGSDTLQIFNVSNPASVTQVGSNVTTGTNPYSVAVSGNYAYVVNEGSDTLQIFNISNPASVTQVGSNVTTGTNPFSVAVSGNYAYVVNYGSYTLQIFNISNPASVTQVGSNVTTGTNPVSVAVSGNYAYVVNGYSNTLQVFDISNPASVTQVGGNISTGTGSYPQSVAISGNYAYVVIWNTGTLQVFNTNTQLLQVESGSGNVFSVSAAGGTNIQDTNGQTTDLLDLQNSNGGVLDSFNANGDLQIGGTNSADSATAFQIQDSAGNDILDVNTINGSVVFQNSTDSSDAFQIQDASGNPVFWVDTTTGAVHQPLLYADVIEAGAGLTLTSTGGFDFNDGVDPPSLFIDSNGATLFQNSTNSAIGFQVQDASGVTLLDVNTSSRDITVSGDTTTFAELTLSNSHFQSTQTTPPTISIPTNCGGGTGPTATVTAGSTDSAGSFTITAGSTGSPTTCVTTLTFNKAYGSAPKSILFSPTTATGGSKFIYLSASSAATFTTSYGTGETNPANSEADTFNYWVIE